MFILAGYRLAVFCNESENNSGAVFKAECGARSDRPRRDSTSSSVGMNMMQMNIRLVLFTENCDIV